MRKENRNRIVMLLMVLSVTVGAVVYASHQASSSAAIAYPNGN